ncbi:MAG: helix-turn-helix domain-containing protein [Ruminococcus sp.]|nr:helix-turn-helix domain-containing protein [Ruminococcus sp.]
MNNNRLIKVPLYTERKKITDFDMYIYGTKNADEQKQDSFGKAMKRYADDIGVNTSDLAKLTGISKSSVSYYFNGERQVGFNTLIELCLALRLHPLRTEYLFELTHFELRRSDPRYYIIKEYLSGCAYDEKFSLYACQMRLKKDNFELLISDKESEV